MITHRTAKFIWKLANQESKKETEKKITSKTVKERHLEALFSDAVHKNQKQQIPAISTKDNTTF